MIKSGYYLNIHVDLLTNELFIIHNKQKLILKPVSSNLLFYGGYENLAIDHKKIENKKKDEFKE